MSRVKHVPDAQASLHQMSKLRPILEHEAAIPNFKRVVPVRSMPSVRIWRLI
jgi:hypothetical protein